MQEHLMIHVVDQIFTLGPLYLHSMFLYEQFFTVLKAYVRNHAHPEGSIIWKVIQQKMWLSGERIT
jgi:thiamine kinase-like enzyme